MDCRGPCMEWCTRTPTVTRFLAAAAVVYALSCVGYLLLTRKYGTPFKDSLTAEQRALLRESKRRRGEAFGVAFTASVVLVLLSGAC